MQPIFLHGMWRSGSTWLWSRFRESETALCFYEPLHHGLAKLTAERIARCDAEVTRANRHPSLDRPYWHEFAPLIRGRGVEAFDRSFAERRFCLRPRERHDRLAAYIQTLIDHAQAQGRTPVLGFNRSGGRVAWLKDRFGSFDIALDRPAATVWGSYAAEAERGNFTYFAMWLRVVSANRRDPVWRPLAQRLGIPELVPHPVLRCRWVEPRRVRSLSAADSYLLTAYAARVCDLHAAAAVDLVIDEGLAADPAARRDAEALIRARTGMAVSLADFRPAPARRPLDPVIRAEVEEELARIFPEAAVRRLARPAAPAVAGWGPPQPVSALQTR